MGSGERRDFIFNRERSGETFSTETSEKGEHQVPWQGSLHAPFAITADFC